MTGMKRAADRRYEICVELLLGPATLPDLAKRLGRWRWTTILDLSALEEARTVASDWVRRDGWPAGRTEYRLCADTEREERDARVTEMRLRRALWAKADTVELRSLEDDEGREQR